MISLSLIKIFNKNYRNQCAIDDFIDFDMYNQLILTFKQTWNKKCSEKLIVKCNSWI